MYKINLFMFAWGTIIAIIMFHRIIFQVLSFFCKAKVYSAQPFNNKYAVLVAARNEKAVILQLIESIKKQSYDKDKIKIFVVADNCTDNTAKIARSAGAIVYERFNQQKISKGYALQFLIANIKNDYDISEFNGFFLFDADNLLAPNFIEKMNNAFMTGKAEVVVSYRNTKNSDTNAMSGGYAFHFYRETFNLHRPRTRLNISTTIGGTGYLMKPSVLENGWCWTSITEDWELSYYIILQGKKILFCEEAVFYDEQPTHIGTMLRQRSRWAKGYFLTVKIYWIKLFFSLLKKPSLSKYDLLLTLTPINLLTFFFSVITSVIFIINTYISENVISFRPFFRTFGLFYLSMYLMSVFVGIIVMIRERHFITCSKAKQIFYTFTWAWFDFFTIPISIPILFKKVEWTPIVHTDSRTIENVNKDNE